VLEVCSESGDENREEAAALDGLLRGCEKLNPEESILPMQMKIARDALKVYKEFRGLPWDAKLGM